MNYKLTLTKTERGKSIKIGELTLKSDPSKKQGFTVCWLPLPALHTQ